MSDLPPDLSRLGDELTAAVGRSVARRERRRVRIATRLAGIAVVVAIGFAALTPQALSPDDERPSIEIGAAIASAGEPPVRCDKPSGVRFRVACLRYGPGARR